MSVQVNNLTKIYGEQKAVNDISFTINTGEVVGFLGPNGAGKSTTMKMLTCYILPTSGEATVYGKDVYEQSIEVRKVIGYLPEHNPLYIEMYVKEYLSFIARTYGIGNRNSRIEELIELTGLTLERHKKIQMLSKGYRQRVGLAQALLHDPQVLVLDEPTSGLDPNQIVDIRNLIREIGKTKTVILSTHIMQEVQAMCNRVIIINRGSIVADSPTAQLLHRSKGTEYLRVEFKNKVEQKTLQNIPGIEQAEEQPHGWLLRCDAGKDIRDKIFRFAVDTGNPIVSLQKEGENLEQVFRELTSEKLNKEKS